MSDPAITSAIPHRPPMLLIDEIVEQDEDHIVCTRKLTGDEFFFQGHYPDQPIVPGVILCEMSLQAGAILLSSLVGDAPGVPVATRLNDVKFKRMVRPGDTVKIEAKLNERLANAFYLTGKVTCEGKLAARLDFACALASASE